MKPILILGGGDWCDASADILDVPDNANLEELKLEYAKWYNDWANQLMKNEDYLSFKDWLIKKKDCKENESIETIRDDI
jgi:hypothetical protein